MPTLLLFSGVILLTLIPLLLMWRQKVALKWAVYGVLSWCIAVIVKAVITLPLDATVLTHFPRPLNATLQGVISALCELGMTALFVRRTPLRLADALVLGMSVGAFEMLFLLGASSLEEQDHSASVASAAVEWSNVFSFLIDRSLAFIGHTSDRLLVILALRRRWIVPALIGVVLFACVDGVSTYGVLAHWNWDAPATHRAFMLFLSLIALIEISCAYGFARTTPEFTSVGE